MGMLTTPYFSIDSSVYHVFTQCTVGNNIEINKLRRGSPYGRTLCLHCRLIQMGQVSR